MTANIPTLNTHIRTFFEAAYNTFKLHSLLPTLVLVLKGVWSVGTNGAVQRSASGNETSCFSASRRPTSPAELIRKWHITVLETKKHAVHPSVGMRL